MVRKSHNITTLFFGFFLSAIIATIFSPLYFYRAIYLDTGYQDWIYHAFRIKQIQLFGITSWDHIWSSGLNHWKMYQYVPHVLTGLIAELFNLNISQSMILTTFGLILIGTLISYIVLNKQKLHPLASTITVLVILTTPTIWGSTRDFSIFTFVLFLPFFLGFWIKSIECKQVSLSTSALAGFSWALHPILGVIIFGLLSIALFVQFFDRKTLSISIVTNIVFFVFSASVFFIPFLFKGINFVGTFFTGPDFTRAVMSNDHWGFGLLTSAALMLSSLGMMFFSKKTPLWSKILTIYSIFICFVIYLMRQGITPSFIYQTQLSRSIPLLAILIGFSLSPIISKILSGSSRYFIAVSIAILGALVVQIIDISSIQLAAGTHTLNEPVSEFFSLNQFPKGTVWVGDVSRASYFNSHGIRFANSYNYHMEPHPLSYRLNMLMKNDLPFTGITKKQVDLIHSYSAVLSIEYMFFPSLSPMISSLIDNGDEQSMFEIKMDTLPKSNFTVLKATRNISNGYLVDKQSGVLDIAPDLPTSDTDSWEKWDNEIVKAQQIISQDISIPVDLEFPTPETVKINLPREVLADEVIWLNISYDPAWTSDNPDYTIFPSNTRLMAISVPEGTDGLIELKHRWPKWHWPLQVFGFSIVLLVIVGEKIWSIFIPKGNHE